MNPDAARRDVVVVGASAGGVRLLQEVFAQLDPGLRAAILVVIHRPPAERSELARVLGRRSALEVREPTDGEAVVPGTIYLAPPDHHMRLQRQRVRLDRGPKEHHTRPAIDPLFVSAAQWAGLRAIGVLASGNLSDGVAGLIAIKDAGGVSLVQDPSEAEWPDMPRNALLHDHVDLLFRAVALPGLLTELVGPDAEAAIRANRRGGRAT